MDKEQFGFSEELQRYLQEVEKSIPSGTFVIIKRGGNRYWYFNRSSGQNRLIYLCPVDKTGGERNSFIYSTKLLKEKVKDDTNRIRRGSLIKVIDNYIVQLRKEGESNTRGVERTKKTIQDIISHIRKFREYVETNPIATSDIPKEGFKEYVSNYISYLIEKELKPPTIKVILVHLRQFLDELVEPRTGKRVINYHPITRAFLKTQFSDNVRTRVQPNFYSEEKYSRLLEICGKEIRECWREFIKTGEKPERYKVVFFTSFLQLVYGFRIGELLTTYVSNNVMKEEHPDEKGGYSYLEETKEDGYLFQIYWKRKYGSVNVDFDVFSWQKPPNRVGDKEVPFTERLVKPNHKKITYSTNIIETIRILFSDGSLLFPIYVDTLRKYFRKHLIEGYSLNNYGVKTPHDLRDMMINYELHSKKTSFVDLSQMTRNKIQTIEKYYLHTSKELSISKSKKLNTRNRLQEIKELMYREK